MNALSTVVLSNINKIKQLTAVMAEMDQVDLPVNHYFSKGVYVREMSIPAGSCVVGKIHKTKHLNIISKGSCKVVTPLREFELTAPCVFESYEGEQKVVYMYEDTVWSNVHVTEETDLDAIEQHCVATEYDEQLVNKLVLRLGETLCLGD
jgi:hypothetical protein